MVHFNRALHIDLPEGQSAFLWGPRQAGKSTLITKQFPDSVHINLLNRAIRADLAQDPNRLQTVIEGSRRFNPLKPVLLDEIQTVPELLDEVHRLIEEKGYSFLMCGSSARKLVRGGANMLGGRAWRYTLHPLTYAETTEFDLLTALNRGLLPKHYQSQKYRYSLEGYIQDYLVEEIFAEGLTRNVPAFSRFFDILPFCNGEMITFSNISTDVGVRSEVVREYFQILVDTLLGTFLEPFSLRRSRAVITKTPKFYLFDVGVASYLGDRILTSDKGVEFGHAFEHFIFMELSAYRSYRGLRYPIRYWRTKSKLECDFVLGRGGESVIEVKGTRQLKSKDLNGLKAFISDYKPRHALLVCNASYARKTPEGILILPWRDFLERLWDDEFKFE